MPLPERCSRLQKLLSVRDRFEEIRRDPSAIPTLASWLVQAGVRMEVIGRVIRQVRRTGGLSHLLSQDQSKTGTHYLGVIRTARGKIVGQEAITIQSWEQLQGIFQQNRDSSLVVIPTGMRLRWLAERLRQLKQEGN